MIAKHLPPSSETRGPKRQGELGGGIVGAHRAEPAVELRTLKANEPQGPAHQLMPDLHVRRLVTAEQCGGHLEVLVSFR